MTALAGVSIFLAAFLLFALEPMVAKLILPWFGGSSAVWSVCLVFYQVALLLGYAYARLLTRYLKPGWQALIHVALMAASLALLPIAPTAYWKPSANANPAWLILSMLTQTIGLPFALLAATSPLLQAWLARSGDIRPYRFFAWSNFASLAALLAYPMAVEPYLDLRQQSFWWSAAFVLFVFVCGGFGLFTRSTEVMHSEELKDYPATISHRCYWFALSACASMLLLSITNHIDQNLAAVPLLWILPLAVYLISFIVAFGSVRFYRRELWLRLLAFALAMLAYAAYDVSSVMPVQISVPVFLAGLFIGCVFCQNELYLLRPHKSQLTVFYLVIAAGGAAGAVIVGLVAPLIFGGIYELPLSLALTAALALALTWRSGGWAARVLWTGVTACMAAVFIINWQAYNHNTLALNRSFYGSLRVVQSPQPGPEQVRTLFHGTIRHGEEFLLPSRRMDATTYYGRSSGVGILLTEWPAEPRRVAVVGLGAGTLAAYGEPGDTFRFYEINPQVIQLAKQWFYFLSESKARIEMIEGDARLSIERESSERYDVIVLDAFSGDAIPVHLLTREAFSLYKRRLRQNGVLAFHVSNDFLDLAPVVCQLAHDAGYQCLVVKNNEEEENKVLASEWVIVTNNERVLSSDVLKLNEVPMPRKIESRIWTDNFSSLLPILKTPEIH